MSNGGFLIHRTISYFILFTLLAALAEAQPDRWQQKVEYEMEIHFDVNTHKFEGTQRLVYYNNSPDTLFRVFYHLYYNAFQPGSMMDLRSRTISDPDRWIGDKIWKLKPEEIGYHQIESLKQDGKKVKFKAVGTILEVDLAKPIPPHTNSTLTMKFNSQVPVQIRRTGRNNKEGIAYSMTQWYPKMAEYDYEGWHANPYIAREFYGVWGDFNVKITIDSSYVIGGTGYLQNPQKIGHGYDDPTQPLNRAKGDRLTWYFKAPQVHDFVWAADPDYQHDHIHLPNGPTLHFYYQPDTLAQNWDSLQTYMIRAFELMNEHFGQYPYRQFSVIQGGDGGMEYPMATLITGHRKFKSLVGVSIHEAMHSWYQGVLATNESKYPWMDEGFTSYGENLISNLLFQENQPSPHNFNYKGYFRLVELGWQEPITTPADYFERNAAYWTSAYGKGAIILNQLSYIIGMEAFKKGMLDYFELWKFKHPNPTDFKRVMEKVSGIELDWYFEQWIGTTNTIDYGIKSVFTNNGSTSVTLEKLGEMPMPIDLVVTLKDSTIINYNIPLRIMRGEKGNDQPQLKTIYAEDWPWTYPEYNLTLKHKMTDILLMEIDPSQRMADIDRTNNSFPKPEELQFPGKATN